MNLPFMHYGVEDDMYRVTYIQGDHTADLESRAGWLVPLEQLDALPPAVLFDAIDKHLQWSNRSSTPFVSVWSDAAHAVNFAKRIAQHPETRPNSVSISKFLAFDYWLINVEEYAHCRGLEMKPYYQHEWLVLNGINIDSVCDQTPVYTDKQGNTFVELE